MVKHDKRNTYKTVQHINNCYFLAAVSMYIVITSLVYTDVRVSLVNASSRHSAGLKSVLFGDQIKLFGLLGLQLDFFSLVFVSFPLELVLSSSHHIYLSVYRSMRHDSFDLQMLVSRPFSTICVRSSELLVFLFPFLCAL
jgi:hypothetical protein